MTKIKIGIIGTGGMARAHAGNLQPIRGVELAACCDVVPGRAEAFAQVHGVRQAFTRVDDLLDAVDAVTIVTPDRFHVPLSIQALKAGKHVLCEKPLALTLADAKKAAKIAGKSGLIHMINFSYRNHAAFHAAAKLVAEGRLGEIRHVQSAYLQHWLATDTWGNWTKEAWLWRIQTAAGSGGALGDVGCHMLDLTTGIAGDLAALACRLHTFPKIDPGTGKPVSKYKGKALDANDTALLELHFTHGAVGTAQTTRWATGHANSVLCEVHGTEGALRVDLDRSGIELQLALGKDRHKLTKLSDWKIKKLKPTPSLYQRFITSIKTGQNDQPDLLRGAQVQAYLDACERSAKLDGKLVKIKSWM